MAERTVDHMHSVGVVSRSLVSPTDSSLASSLRSEQSPIHTSHLSYRPDLFACSTSPAVLSHASEHETVGTRRGSVALAAFAQLSHWFARTVPACRTEKDIPI